MPDLAGIGADVAVFGGVTFARLRENAARLRNGWVTTYTEDELVSLFGAAGWQCSDRRTWTTADGDERIFVFERR